VDGSSFDGASLRDRPVLLWFWAPWCPTCRSQLPEVQRIASAYGDRLQVVGVGSLDSRDAIARFAEQTSDFTVQLVDEKGSIWRHFDITEQSSFVLLDSEGKVVHRSGYGGDDDLEREVEAAVRG
jgi:thiol-disulfide isomerase/thioredoxin